MSTRSLLNVEGRGVFNLYRHTDQCVTIRHPLETTPEECDCGGYAPGEPDRAIRRVEIHNRLTQAGVEFYAACLAEILADSPAGTTPTPDLSGACHLGTNGSNPESASANSGTFDITGITGGTGGTLQSGFPVVNDASSDNGGGGLDVVTFKWRWAAGVGTASALSTVGMMATTSTPGTGTDSILNISYQTNWTPSGTINKGANDQLDHYLNHQLNDV